MRLRNREKSKPVRVVDDENEEDVDDPADDSDGDPEWEEPEVKPDGTMAAGLGKKRKSFMPLQMKMEQSKIQKIGEPSSSKGATSATSSSSSATSAASSSSGATATTTDYRRGGRSYATRPNLGETKSPKVTITTGKMIVKDKRGVPTECEFRVLKTERSTKTPAPSTSKIPTVPPSSFSHGDFLKDITKTGDWIWQVDGMNLLQKFVPTKDAKTGEVLYKSSFTYDGLNAMNAPKFQKISTTVINKIKNETFVRVNEDLNPLEVKAEPVDVVSDNVVSSSEPAESDVNVKPDISKPENNASSAKQLPSEIRMPVTPFAKSNPALALVHQLDAPGIGNYKNVFKDDFTVFLQALISQCLDPNFLRACYNDNDEYFLEKIKTIDDVLEAKKFSLMSLPSFPNNERILYAIHMYPVIEEQQLPAIKMENLNCVVCIEQGAGNTPACSSLCLKLTGEPYERNTLLSVKLLVDIDDDLKVLRVCSNCSKILKLYSKMCHTKYLIFKQCEKIVAKVTENQKEKMEASEVIINLLNNEPWCETKLLQVIKDWISVDDLKKET